jgi:hypothetical protein
MGILGYRIKKPIFTGYMDPNSSIQGDFPESMSSSVGYEGTKGSHKNKSTFYLENSDILAEIITLIAFSRQLSAISLERGILPFKAEC